MSGSGQNAVATPATTERNTTLADGLRADYFRIARNPPGILVFERNVNE
jgi:hypothetical protein